MKQIPLTKGLFTLVDDEDYEWLSKWRWVSHSSQGKNRPKRWSAARWIGSDRTYIFMHREIMGQPEEKEVDHINRNTLDNRRSNLRLATRPQNAMNRKLHRNNTSGYKGVAYEASGKRRKRWRAWINIDKKQICVGLFHTPEEAARAYDEAAIEHHNEFALTNKSLGLLK